MALSRAMLKGMGLSEEQISAIIDAHSDTVNALKEERDRYKEDAKKIPEMQKELDQLKGGEDWRTKYDSEHKAFEDYKKEIVAKEEMAKIKSAYRTLLVDAKIGDKYVDTILRATDFTGMKLDKDGNLVDADGLTKSIKSDWSGFITTTGTNGADVETPPGDNGGSMTREAFEKLSLSERMQYANAHPGEVHTFYKQGDK